MVTRNKHDLIRERRLRRKLERVVEENTPKAPETGFRRARCPICGEKYVVNNNAKRVVRPLRMLGVAICANCFYRKGTERLVRIYKLGKELSNAGTLDDDGILTIHVEGVGDLIRLAKELFK